MPDTHTSPNTNIPNTNTDELSAQLARLLDAWDTVRRDREAAAEVDDLTRTDDLFATMSEIADDAMRLAVALVDALRAGARVPGAWLPHSPARSPAPKVVTVSEAPYRCLPVTDDPDGIDLMNLAVGHGTVENIDHRKDNETRASWGLAAVHAYIHRGRLHEDPPDTTLNALVADLMHLCDLLGLDFADVIEGGRNHYHHELRGE